MRQTNDNLARTMDDAVVIDAVKGQIVEGLGEA